eukprot:7573307-Ditylum_brightwellii.AAC.1
MGGQCFRTKRLSQGFSCDEWKPQPLDADELMDILEYGVSPSWCREFTVQGFHPVDQGLRKFVEFCTRLVSCEPSKSMPKGEKPTKLKTAGKRKAEVLTTPTSSA